jgi:hypothetical protein
MEATRCPFDPALKQLKIGVLQVHSKRLVSGFEKYCPEPDTPAQSLNTQSRANARNPAISLQWRGRDVGQEKTTLTAEAGLLAEKPETVHPHGGVNRVTVT